MQLDLKNYYETVVPRTTFHSTDPESTSYTTMTSHKLNQSQRTPLGVQYCYQLGHATSGAGLTLTARWETEGCPHHGWIENKKHTKMCCGYTTIPSSKHGESQRLLGWNPDCKAETFHIKHQDG